jgi:hypothetical protein
MAVTGTVREEGQAVAAGALLSGTKWLELDKGAAVTVRHTVSSRELSVKGPGWALLCLDGEEEVLLSEGTLESSAGPGARPGAQVVIYTPAGTISYGDAQITARASKAKIEVSTSKGDVWVLPVHEAKRKGPEKLGGARDRATLTPGGALSSVVEACERTAGEAEARAKAVLGPPGAGAGPLGERAAAHLEARRTARATCNAALAAARAEPSAETRVGLERRIAEAGRRWRSLGVPAGPAPKPSAP